MTSIDQAASDRVTQDSVPLTNQSHQWQLAEEVAEIIGATDELRAEIWFLVGELTQPNGGVPLSIKIDSISGSVCFIEDCFGNVWLTRDGKDSPPWSARCLAVDDASCALAELCFETLTHEANDQPGIKPLH